MAPPPTGLTTGAFLAVDLPTEQKSLPAVEQHRTQRRAAGPIEALAQD